MNYYTYSEIFSSSQAQNLRQTYTNIQKSDKIKKRNHLYTYRQFRLFTILVIYFSFLLKTYLI